jgi:hypothetical protein
MRSSTAVVLLLMCIIAPSAARAASDSSWRITKTEWTETDERGFGEFVRVKAASGCPTTTEYIAIMVLRRRNGGECEPANTQADGNSGAIVAPTIIAAILVRVSAQPPERP